MKVLFKNMLSGYIGNADEMIYYYDSRLDRILARRKPHIKPTAKNYTFGQIVKNLMGIRPSQAYKDDLISYSERCFNVGEFGNVRPIWNNLYMKIMFAMRDDYPHLDLLTLTREQILSLDLPCRTVGLSILAGYLPEVRNWQEFTGEI